MCNKGYRKKIICDIRQVLFCGDEFNVHHSDILLDKIIVEVYNAGFEDCLDECSDDRDGFECREPIYNEGYD